MVGAFEELLPRGVWVERYTVNGHRIVFSIDSRGEQVRLRSVPNESDAIQAAIDELWEDLDKVNPAPPSAFPSLIPSRLLHLT